MGLDFYIFLIVLLFLLTILILSFFGPEHSEIPFWSAVQKIRRIMDLTCYWFMTAMGILAVLFAIYCSIKESLSSGRLNLSTAIVMSVVFLLCFHSYRSIRKEAGKGVLCDCQGDCSNCKIQCRKNPKYYGSGN